MQATVIPSVPTRPIPMRPFNTAIYVYRPFPIRRRRGSRVGPLDEM